MSLPSMSKPSLLAFELCFGPHCVHDGTVLSMHCCDKLLHALQIALKHQHFTACHTLL